MTASEAADERTSDPGAAAKLRILTLGCFDMRRGEHSLLPQGKAPRIPIALLLLLVTAGPEGGRTASLAERLWPSDDAAGAGRLKVVVHRLRRLIGAPDVIVASGSTLRLSAEKVWLDAWELESLSAFDDRVAACERAMSLYRGPFAADLAADASLLIYQQHLEARFGSIVAAHAGALAAEGRDEEALGCAREGLMRAPHELRLFELAAAAAARLGRTRERAMLEALVSQQAE